MNERPDSLDKMVYSATHKIRNIYYDACERLGIKPTTLTPITLMQRSVPERKNNNVYNEKHRKDDNG